MNTELWKKAKYGFKRDFSKLMNNSVFGKTIENVKKKKTWNLWLQKKEETISCQNQIIVKWFFSQNLSDTDIKKTQILINKPLYLGLSKS